MAWFVLLGLLRTSTDAEYAFASAAIIPVLLVTWAGGLRQGVLASIFAVAMWVVADALSDREWANAGIALLNGFIRLLTYCFVAYMTSQVRILLNREAELARYDVLTGLLNRRAFLDAGAAEARRASRYPQHLAVAFLDLDDFKKLNDSRGHSAGDTALSAVALALKQALRGTDTMARLGGDEFAIMLPETDLPAATGAGRKIAAAVAEALAPFAPVTASVGVAWFDKPADNFEAMLEAADSLMYEAKRGGKGGLCIRSFP
ncbi:MAG: GGDEF domain-containing protein [Betaproteobacteria bacterium]|nr:GGDEF domain-containing protein [Betaproteobacteria bacterium]